MTDSAVGVRAGGTDTQKAGLRRLWNRQLSGYPETGPRTLFLAITVLATVTLYYEFYVQGSVATQIIREFGFSFRGFIMVQAIGAAFGAFASIVAGMADRWGRANLVVGGLLVSALLVLFAMPNAGSRFEYGAWFTLLSVVEGATLVAAPALMRDFSPQSGRAAAMGFWAMGPVLGSLLVTLISSSTLDSHPNWRTQFHISGVVGLVVWVIALLGLRELSPAIRDQLMVSSRDRALIEAKAAGIDTDKLQKGHWRQMLRLDIMGASLGIGIFLLMYFVLVGALTVYLGTNYGWSESKSNSLGNWYWITNAITLLVVGLISDRVKVRKPFMAVGVVLSLAGSIPFALAATNHQSYHTLGFIFIIGSAGTAMVLVSFMAAYTETVEKHNPAATATGLAIYGWTLRIVATFGLVALTFIVTATSTLVDKAGPIQAMQAQDAKSFAIITTLDPHTAAALQANPQNPGADVLASALTTVAKVNGLNQVDTTAVAQTITSGEAAAAQAVAPATLAKLQTNPTDAAAGAAAVGQIVKALGVTPDQAVALLKSISQPATQQALATTQKLAADLQTSAKAFTAEQLSYLQENGAKVAQAAQDNASQWKTWWWICAIAQLLFLPFVFLLTGRWSPRRAREDYESHEAMVQRELAALKTTNG